MFSECSSLESIDLSSFNTNNVNDMICIFSGCSTLKKDNVRVNKFEKKILSQFKNN